MCVCEDKADIKKCVVAGLSLTICHGGPVVGSQRMLIMATGIKGGLLPGDHAIKTANNPIRARTKTRTTCTLLRSNAAN